MFLSRQELRLLTDTPRRDRQAKWLEDNGIGYLMSVTDHPKVLLSEIERHMMRDGKRKGKQPNWASVT